MASDLILTTAQAQAVYSAMCALNSAHIRACDMRFGSAIVTSDFNGVVRVVGKVEQDDERYADQIAFADAYGLSDRALQLQSLARRLAYPDAGELLTLDDYRNVARNILQPDGVRA